MQSGQQPNTNLVQPVKPPVTTRVAVPAGDDPLAAGAITQIQNMTPSIPTKQQQNFRQHQNAIPAPPPPPIGTASVEAKTTTGNNTPTTPSPVPVRGGGGGETSISPSSKSLDALADDFLSSKPPPILLSPNPLPRGEAGIVRLRTLVERRAWGDVLKLASTLLSNNGSNSTSSSSKSSSSFMSRQYSKVYASLLLREHEQEQLNNNDDNDNDNDVPPNIRQDTVEIMILQCNAWLMLRRYADLSKEIERWNFLTQNDTTAKSPEWIPWSIRKFVLVLVKVLCISLLHIVFVNCISAMLTTLLKLCICVSIYV
jgi:hypothetical protein